MMPFRPSPRHHEIQVISNVSARQASASSYFSDSDGCIRRHPRPTPRHQPPARATRPSLAGRRGRHDGCPSAAGPELLAELRSWRREESGRRGVPAYAVLTDAALEAVAERAPRTEEELLATERKVVALYDAIEQAAERGDWRPNRSRLCDWCAFQAQCPLFGGTTPQVPDDGIARLLTARRTAA